MNLQPRPGTIGLVAAPLMIGLLAWAQVEQRNSGVVRIDPDDIGGVVTGAAGPEAGVWVIAEAMDLETRFIRIVVTDDQGKYVLPDGPTARPHM